MKPDSDRIAALFTAALAQPAQERSAYLDGACAGDATLRHRVDALLYAHDAAGSFLKPPADANGAGPRHTVGYDPAADPTGSVIAGRYKLLQEIGDGGMGVVYMAEQEQPVRRRVALKIIKPGLDTAQVVARFEAERQALAMMDHQNIAKVLDAGATTEGRPFFVMELVHGVPITKFCDDNKLTPRERLELFVPVCQAIQHAHQKGIIHRDIKPSNVLVTLYDDKPVPKVIDFGVAKATEQRLTDKTMFTQFGTMVGTFEYMSPEQAAMNAFGVDTRSDIYSLGVVLYELLTGTTPLERKRLREAAFDELVRIIKEEEPQKPSTRLSTSGSLPVIAAARKTEPAKLSRLVRGEVDWIVMKCLEKDRTRRYETANGLARDIERYLHDEPVEACPPSAAYRLRKFTRKHRTGLTAAAAFAALVFVGVVASAWQAVRATNAERLARERLTEAEAANAKTEQALDDVRKAQGETKRALQESQQALQQSEAVSRFLVDAFRKADPNQDGRTLTVAAMLAQAEKPLLGNSKLSPITRAALLRSIGLTYLGLGLPYDAVRLLEPARALQQQHRGPDHPSTLASMHSLAAAYEKADRLADALPLLEETLRLRKARLGPDDRSTLATMNGLGWVYFKADRVADAVALLEETLRLSKAKLGPEDPETLAPMTNLAAIYSGTNRLADALPLLEELFRLRKSHRGPDSPETLGAMANLARGYLKVKRYADAVSLLEETLRLSRARLGPDHPETVRTIHNLAVAYQDSNRATDAVPLFEEALRLRTARLGPDHYDAIASMSFLGAAYTNTGREADAVPLFEEALRRRKAKQGLDHPDTLGEMGNLALTYRAVGRGADAVPLYEELLRMRQAKLGPDHLDTLNTMDDLGICYREIGRHSDALPLQEEALRLWTVKLGADHADTLAAMTNLGQTQLRAKKFGEAEALLRECLAIGEKKQPDAVDTARARSQLGAALAGQQKYAEAEPLLLSGYQGLKDHGRSLTAGSRARIFGAALEWLVQFYEAINKPDEAAKWRKELEAVQKK